MERRRLSDGALTRLNGSTPQQLEPAPLPFRFDYRRTPLGSDEDFEEIPAFLRRNAPTAKA